MRQHAAAAPSTAWFHPSVRDVRYRAPRTVSAVAPPARTIPARRRRASARSRACPGSSASSGGSGGSEQKRVEDYLARSVDVADLEMRLRSLERRAPSGF